MVCKNKSIFMFCLATLAFMLVAALDAPASAGIILRSDSFENGAYIPEKYSGKGEDVSPELKWENAPAGTVSFSIIADDPDAPSGNWSHWVIYDIPEDVTALSANIPKVPLFPNGIKQGSNDFRKIGYNGPYPPAGSDHRYFYTIYALDAFLEIPAGRTKNEILAKMEGHVLDKATLAGRFKR